MRAMHPTMAAAKAAQVDLHNLTVARDKECEAVCPGYADAAEKIAKLRAAIKTVKAASNFDAVKSVKDRYKEAIEQAEKAVTETRAARKAYLESKKPKTESADA